MTDAPSPAEPVVTPPPPPPPPKEPAPSEVLSRRRRILIWAIVVLASIIGLLSILTTWVNRQMLDDDAWQRASAQVIRDPRVQQSLSVYIVNQLYDRGNVEAQLEKQLPNNLKPLAGPISAALREPATKAVGFLLQRPRIQQVWIDANGVAHEKLVNVLENKTGFGIDTGGGTVTVDLHELVQELGVNLGLPQSALDKLPANAGVITVMRSDQLSAAQTGIRAIKILSVWLLVLVLLLYALAIYLARGIRRETLRNIGWAFVLVGLLVLVLRRSLGNYVITALAEPNYRITFHHVWFIETSILGEIGWAVVLYGVIGVLGAILAGPTRAGTATRRWLAPVLNQRQGMAWSIVAAVFLLLVLWGPTHALRTWGGVLILGALLALGVYVLRLQTLEEFPDAGLAHAPGSGMMEHMRGLWARRGTAHKSSASPAEEIARLQQLHDAGAITPEEFARGKQIALS